MAYLTTGKRSIMQNEYQAEVNKWARACHATAPLIVVRQRRGGSYKRKTARIFVPPSSSRDMLVHEFAHHISRKRGHGAPFRIALVEAATIAYGRAYHYPWASEYHKVAVWARKHGLTTQS